MQSTKIIMTLWVRWKNPVKLAITLCLENVEGAQDTGNAGDNYIRADIPFPISGQKFLKVVILTGLIQRMFSYTKTQVENPRMPGSGFTLDKIIHLNINFHRVALILKCQNG